MRFGSPPSRGLSVRVALAVGVVLLLVAPLLPESTERSSSVPAAPALPPRATTPLPMSPTSADGILPGTDPTANMPAPPTAVVVAQINRDARPAVAPVASPEHSRNGSTNDTGRDVSPAVASNGTSGWFTGTVANSSDTTEGLAGVGVVALPVQTPNPCIYQACIPSNDGTDGSFNVSCPVGSDYVLATTAGFAGNLTYATCTAGQSVAVGTIYLVPDGYVTGVVRGDVVGQPALSGVTVQGESRDLSVLASPQNVTTSTGSFRVAVPPFLASALSFSPGNSSYLANLTWVSVPTGRTVDLGTVFLEPVPEALVEASFYDAVTGAPVNGTTTDPLALTLCSSSNPAFPGPCGVTGTASSGNTVEATGPSGEDYIVAMVAGYLTNSTPIGTVLPGVGSGPTCIPNACEVEMMPLGGVSGTIGISGNVSALFDGGDIGDVRVQDCGLEGFTTPLGIPPSSILGSVPAAPICFNSTVAADTSFEVPAFPLRNDLQIEPITTLWPIPSDLPVIGNETWANVTPDEVTALGFVNLTPGSYVEGQVFAGGTGVAPPGGFLVTVASRIQAEFSWTASGGGGAPCPDTGASYFCVPLPPGPSKLSVESFAPPQEVNWTWLDLPWAICCVADSAAAGSVGPFTLAQVTDPAIQSLNLTGASTSLPTVTGTVVLAVGGSPVANAQVGVCSAAPDATSPCVDTLTDGQGRFTAANVSAGWDNVLSEAVGLDTNSEWVFANGTTAAPPLPLDALATLTGTVLTSGGNPAVDATITYCAVDLALPTGACTQPLGPGITESDGVYLGLVRGGWLPWTTYEVLASAPGYAPDWTWANASVGATAQVPTLVLAPLGAGAAPHEWLAAPRAATSTWLVGRLVDPTTGLGVAATSISACPVGSSLNCVVPIATYSSNVGGFFNFSVASGLYDLQLSATGYSTLTELVNATQPPADDLGTLRLTALPWIWGNVTLDPWSRVAVTPGTGGTVEVALAPPVGVSVCTATLPCTPSVPDGTGGEFEVTTYLGFYLQLDAASSAQVDLFVGQVNVTTGEHGLPPAAWPRPVLWAAVSGSVWDAASSNGAGGYTDPVRWADVHAANYVVGQPSTGATTLTLPAGGRFVVFVPSGGTTGTAYLDVRDPDQYYAKNTTIAAVLGPPTNLSWALPPLALQGYGWAETTVVNAVSGAPLSNATVVASYYDPSTLVAGTTSDISNLGGFVNLSAPAGQGVLFTFSEPGAFNSSSLRANVTAGQTTVLSGPNGSTGVTVNLEPDGWIGSAQVNYSVPAGYLGTLRDPVAGAPVPAVLAIATSSDPSVTYGTSLPSNDLGEFLAVAPVGADDGLTLVAPGFVAATSPAVYAVAAGSRVGVPPVNLTGKGIVAGAVVADPGGVPVPGATVTLCSSGGGCTSVITNESGEYAAAVAPGTATITAVDPVYVANASSLATVTSDAWVNAPTLILLTDAELEGTVVGLPVGLPVAGANVSVCSSLGSPTGPCSYSVIVPASGEFAVTVVPGTFVLVVAAPDFNTTYSTLAVNAGSVIELGNVYLQEFGVVRGVVQSAATGAPVVGALVYGCALGPVGPCGDPSRTDGSGSYGVAVPSGTVTILVSAGGFEPGTLRASVRSGATTVASALQLVPLAEEGPWTVQGRVVSANLSSVGLSGAALEFLLGSTVVAATVTDAKGAFAATVDGGSYTLEAHLQGYTPASVTLTVAGNRSGVLLALSPWLWNVSLTVLDGLTAMPIPRAIVSAAGTTWGSTSSVGTLAVGLPNGTYTPTATAPEGPVPYDSLPFELRVNGAVVVRQVELYPPSAVVTGVVRSASSGVPIPGAQLAVRGTVLDGASWVASSASNQSGAFAVTLYYGTYLVSAGAPGFASDAQNVSVGVGTGVLAFRLSSTGNPGAAPPSLPLLPTVAGAVLIAAGVVLLGRRGFRRPPADLPVVVPDDLLVEDDEAA